MPGAAERARPAQQEAARPVNGAPCIIGV